MVDVRWHGSARNLLLKADGSLHSPFDLRDDPESTVLVESGDGHNIAIRYNGDGAMAVGTYNSTWISHPITNCGEDRDTAIYVGAYDQKHKPEWPIILSTGRDRLRILPGDQPEAVHDVLANERFKGTYSHDVAFHDPNTLERKVMTYYVMGDRIPCPGLMRYVAFVRGIPKLPWFVDGVDIWRRRLGLAILRGTHVRESLGIITHVFRRDPLVDPDWSSPAPTRLPWRNSPWRRDLNGKTYIWNRSLILELESVEGVAQFVRQSYYGVPLEAFQESNIVDIMDAKL